jgi:hypothetical protein
VILVATLVVSLAAAAAMESAEPHAAAELWDSAFASREACESALSEAIREAETEQLHRLYVHAECYAVGGAQKHYRVRPRWTRRPVRSGVR